MTNSARNFLLLVALAASWGPSFLFIKVAVEYVPPITITAGRMAVASLVLFVILKFQKTKIPPLKPLLKTFTIAALLQGAIPFTLFGVAEKTVDSAFASIFTGSAPLFAMVMAHFFMADDRISKAKFGGAILGFLGLFFLIMPQLLKANADIFGILVLTVAANCYACAFVYTKKYINISSYPPLTVPAIQVFISFLFLTIASLIFEQPWNISDVPVAALLSIFGLGIFGTALAFVLYYKLISFTNVSYISMVNYIVPIFGVLLGVIVLNEKLLWNSYLGGAMILLGVMLANGVIKFNRLIKK